MRIEPSTLKIAGALGTLTVASAATVTVVADQRPGAAPLRPPVAGGASVQPAVDAAAGSSPSLTIPQTPVCEKPGAGNLGGAGTTATGAGGFGAASAADPAVRTALSRWQAAPAASRRQVLQQVMQSLSADQRQQLTALIQQAQRAAQAGRGAGPLGGCRGSDSGGTGDGTGSGGISASVTDPSAPSTPVTVSAVS